jgi:hypothetical protein
VIVESEPEPRWQRNLQRIERIGRRRVCYGQDADPLAASRIQHDEYDRAGTVFSAFFAPGFGLAFPEVGISDHQARVR